ncbi:MAG: hypothetical protein M3R63_22155 [Actinomycetota bacterium]|nr:hypothetical protein [Actinomycetota bacterium]
MDRQAFLRAVLGISTGTASGDLRRELHSGVGFLADMARQAVDRGHLEDGLSLVELAQVRQDRLTPTVRTMLSTVRARVLAAHHRPGDALGAVSAAEDPRVDHLLHRSAPGGRCRARTA